ncbi:hypothetical protein ACXYTJ_10915 [Gilvimarinus sp. F26214L]|uniref:hypothetical protein n=1 Tax=Gilvimarinus sp. DZF01 TaxID=3461371 RepID=UPI00404544AF
MGVQASQIVDVVAALGARRQILILGDGRVQFRKDQSIADSNDCEVPLGLRTNYSVVLEEQAQLLRKLLNDRFESCPG